MNDMELIEWADCNESLSKQYKAKAMRQRKAANTMLKNADRLEELSKEHFEKAKLIKSKIKSL